jgi:hypothetical protein
MHRGVLVGLWTLALALPSAGVSAQQQRQQQAPRAQAAQQKPMKDQLVGTWALLMDDGVLADGSHRPNFGPNPMGILIFTSDGHYSLQVERAGRPTFASNNRAAGTAAENKAAIAGMGSHFGTYTVDEAAKNIVFRTEGSLFPNQDGVVQKRNITALTDDVLTYSNPVPSNPSGVTHGEVAWKKVK